MIKAPVVLQDLRRKIYAKAKADGSWRFWGLYVHVCKMETLRTAFERAKDNDGAPGIDGVTFAAIEEQGVESFLEQIRDELTRRTYKPMRVRKREIPKDGGKKVRILSIPTIRDRVVQGALKLILEPIFEADFQSGSYGYRPKKTAHEAINRVAQAIVQRKTRVIDLDLRSYFDGVRHDVLLAKVAKRIKDDDVMHLLKIVLKATGRKGVPQGGVISPVLSNLYLNEVDRMLERAKQSTRCGKYTFIEYARFADDLVIIVGLERGESFGFLGFDFRRVRSLQGAWRPQYTPKLKKRTALLRTIKEVFRQYRSQPVTRVIELINPMLRGWVNYFAVGHSGRCFHYIRDWVAQKVRRHVMQARKCRGYGWGRWSRQWLYETLGLFGDYRVRYFVPKAT